MFMKHLKIEVVINMMLMFILNTYSKVAIKAIKLLKELP